VLVQRRRDTRAALRLMRKLLKKQGFAPKLLVTDKLRYYASAFRHLRLTCRHEQGRRVHSDRVRVNTSIRYHAKRRAFFDAAHRLMMLIGVIGGSAAFFALLSNSASMLAKIAAFSVAVATAIDLVFSLPEKAREHDKLCERFSDLAAEIMGNIHGKSDRLIVSGFRTKRLIIEKHEPTMMPALNLICHNEEARARGYGESELYSIGWLQLIFAQFCTFPWFVPQPLAKSVQLHTSNSAQV
jgi:DDE superfamily endonuclease